MYLSLNHTLGLSVDSMKEMFGDESDDDHEDFTNVDDNDE